MMDRKTRTRKKISNALMGIKADSDSCDSAQQKELSGTNSNWDSEEKKKFIKKKKNKSFPKNLRDFMTRSDNNSQTNGSNNNNNDNTVQNKRGSNPVKWDDLYDYDSSNRMNNHHDILEEEEEDEEEEELIPRLPRGKKMVDTIVGTDVDSLYRSVFENDTFFEIVNSKAYEEFRNYDCSRWMHNRTTGLWERRLTYELSKTIAFSMHHVSVEQKQIRLGYSRTGIAYGVDTITENQGVAYADYFRLHIHYRFLQTENPSQSQLIVIADIEFVKPCLFKGRIESEAWSGLKKYYDVVTHEVQLERDPFLLGEDNMEPHNINGISYSKLLKENYNYKRMSSRSNPGSCHQCNSKKETGNPVYFSQEVMMVAFVMVILVLIMLTVALFKMNATIANLDERLLRVEETLERNARLFQLLMQDEQTNK